MSRGGGGGGTCYSFGTRRGGRRWGGGGGGGGLIYMLPILVGGIHLETISGLSRSPRESP